MKALSEEIMKFPPINYIAKGILDGVGGKKPEGNLDQQLNKLGGMVETKKKGLKEHLGKNIRKAFVKKTGKRVL